MERLRKVLALTTSPMEGEAQAASEMLAKLLEQHNLDMADLETKGQAAPGIQEKSHDLGKAAFTWKLNLAEDIADHYFCVSLVDRKAKTVVFVGRPDNVESLKMLYQWLIDQIRRISADERRKHIAETKEHIDPLRWQVNFGIGAAFRLGQRLRERAEKDASVASTALVVHHTTEISDYFEEKYGYRKDGKTTKADQEWHRKWMERAAQRDIEEKRMAELLKTDPEEYYKIRPWERPEEVAKRRADEEKRARKEEARQRRNEARRKGTTHYRRDYTPEEYRRMEQGWTAKESGHKAGDRINLDPFIDQKRTEHARVGNG
jgi:hypothetical protein